MRLFFERYILAGLIFQSVMIAGGYATGRELVQFFLSHGPRGGLIGLFLATLVISVVMPVGFEFARTFRSYDYYSYLKKLLGRFWILFELGYGAAVVLILSVIASAVGSTVSEKYGISTHVAALSFMAMVGVIVYFGSALIEKVLSLWSLLLYMAYATLFYLVMNQFGGDINANISSGGIIPGHLSSGTLFATLQMTLIPAVLFVAVHFEERKHAVIAGVLAGPIAMIPAFLMFFAMLAFYPEIAAIPVPMTYILDRIDATFLALVIQLVILGTFVETGTALVHSVNERIATVMREHNREIKDIYRPMIAVGLMIFSAYLATAIGIIDLVGKGYVYMAYYFVVIFIIPLMTIGLYRIINSRNGDAV